MILWCIRRWPIPTYLVGAKIAGCQAVACDDLDELGDAATGTDLDQFTVEPDRADPGRRRCSRHALAWARERGAIVASDECYGEFGWEAEPVSVLHPIDLRWRPPGLLAVHSLSKRSNLAGYRAGFVAGDDDLVADLLAVRKHAGHDRSGARSRRAMIDLLGDQDHVEEQRRTLSGAPGDPAASAGGGGLPHRSLRRWHLPVGDPGRGCRASVDFLARKGILVAPGDFYGAAASRHVRFALTATDERIAAAAARRLPTASPAQRTVISTRLSWSEGVASLHSGRLKSWVCHCLSPTVTPVTP